MLMTDRLSRGHSKMLVGFLCFCLNCWNPVYFHCQLIICHKIGEISGSHSNEYEDDKLLGCHTVLSGRK
jgi:hypothetical protein